MPPNMEWKCCSLVFLFGYKISIVTMFLSRNVTELSVFLSKSCMLLAKKYIYVTYIKRCSIENQINTFQSMNSWFQATENGKDLAHF